MSSFYLGDGCIDLSYNRDLTADEFEVFTMLLLSLNRKKYPLKILKLDSCDITGNLMHNRSLTPKNLCKYSKLVKKFALECYDVFLHLDEKLAKLAPLIAKFEKVTLNGSQKMTAVGWEEVR